MSLVIVGSVAFDTIETPQERPREDRRRVRHLLRAGGQLLHPAADRGRGGRGLSPETSWPSSKARSIDLAGSRFDAGKTFHWEGRYGDDPNQRDDHPDRPQRLRRFPARAPRRPTARPSILFLANIDPDLQDDILAQVGKPGSWPWTRSGSGSTTKPEALRRVLGRVDIYFANDEEVRLLTGETQPGQGRPG